jgi:hypothetical protein
MNIIFLLIPIQMIRLGQLSLGGFAFSLPFLLSVSALLSRQFFQTAAELFMREEHKNSSSAKNMAIGPPKRWQTNWKEKGGRERGIL